MDTKNKNNLLVSSNIKEKPNLGFPLESKLRNGSNLASHNYPRMRELEEVIEKAAMVIMSRAVTRVVQSKVVDANMNMTVDNRSPAQVYYAKHAKENEPQTGQISIPKFKI